MTEYIKYLSTLPDGIEVNIKMDHRTNYPEHMQVNSDYFYYYTDTINNKEDIVDEGDIVVSNIQRKDCNCNEHQRLHHMVDDIT